MRKLMFTLFIYLLLGLCGVYSQKVPIFFIAKEGGTTEEEIKKSNSLNDMFFTDIINETLKNWPCVSIKDEKAVKISIGELHLWSTPEFGGKDVLAKINEAANANKNSDYYVSYSIYPVNDEMANAEIKWYDKKGNQIDEISMACKLNEVYTNAATGPAMEFVNMLKKHEICPYIGPIAIEVKGIRDETTTTSSSAPCGNGSLTITTTSTMNSTLSWSFKKLDLNETSGTVDYTMNEKLTTIMDYSCYMCISGIEGAVKITDTRDSDAKVEGLSNKSVFEGNKIDDARVQIVFKDNGTYMLLVEATSKKGTLKETIEKVVEGPCQDESKPADTKQKAIDVPLKVVFGPYPGKPTDEVLTQNETKDVSVGQDKTIIEIDFTLVRELL